MTRKIDCTPIYERVMKDVTSTARELSSTGHPATLATVLVGEDPASNMYVKMKHEIAEGIGIRTVDLRLPASVRASQLTNELRDLSARPDVDAILVQYPLPRGLDYTNSLLSIDPDKDVDGLHALNMGRMATGNLSGVLPCTPSGIVELLRSEVGNLDNINVSVVGRGLTIGRPLSIMLSTKELGLNANVTVLHSRTSPAVLARHLSCSQVVVAAAGMPGLIQPEWIAPNSVLVAAGVSFPSGKAVSDFSAGCRERSRAWTPVTGAVGLLTRAYLFKNVLRCATMARN